MKIFAAGIATETNTFSPVPTGLEDFMVQRAGDTNGPRPPLDLCEVWGKPARAGGHEFVFGLYARAQPSGTTLKHAYEILRDEMLRRLQEAMPVDVVLLMLHGAMVAEGYEDCEADIIRRVRNIVGSTAVIGVELDLHCQLTSSTIARADIVITYKEYPHTDVSDRAGELFRLAIKTRRGEVRPTMALFDCRMVGAYPTTRTPMREFVDAMTAAERRPGVLSVSFCHGFPYSDLPHLSAKMLAVTDNDRALAEETARELGLKVYEMRQKIGFDLTSLPMDEALSRALASDRTPVVVADQSDNAGGGAPGDSTFALRWLLDRRAQDVAIALLYDPEVVRIAKKAGTGARLQVRVGGKMGRLSGDPVDIEVTVGSVLDDYRHSLPQQSGEPIRYPTGDIAALRCGSIDIVVSSKPCQCFSPSIFSDLDIDPRHKRLLIAKSTQHFYGAFAAIAGEVIYMAAPGALTPDTKQIPYRRLDTTRLYPWNEDPLATN